jgi:hypothetical protein
MRWIAVSLIVCAASAASRPTRADTKPAIHCDDLATADLTIDGLLDDWTKPAVARVAGVSLRCAWDGTALALALDVQDDKIVRVRSGKGHEDHVDVTLTAGGKPVALTVFPGNAIAKSRVLAPAKISVADSLQPKGFSIEALVPAARIPELSPSTPAIELRVVFHDSDAAMGGADTETELAATIELSDRKDLLDDFLSTVHLKKSDVKLDVLAELDPDRKGKERLVAGGTVIGVLTEQFAYVSMPAASAADVLGIALLPLGPRGQQVISAVVRQRDATTRGTRDLLMLWVVWSGQLSQIAQIEVRKELGGKVLASAWRVSKGAKGPELLVTPKPAVGWTAETWNEQSADDADSIVAPWDAVRGGVGYTLHGADVVRRDLAPARAKR